MSIDWDIDTITDPAVNIDHHAAVREIRDTKRPKEEMYRAALYTYRLCYVTRQLTQKQYARQLGYSEGYITRLKRIGRALVVHGVAPDSALYSVLINKADRREYGRLIEAEPPMSLVALERAVAELEEQEQRPRERTQAATPETAMMTAIDLIREHLAYLSPETRQRLEDLVGDCYFELRQMRRSEDTASKG